MSVRLRTRVPLAGSYPAAVSLALLALCPFLVLSSASTLFEGLLMRDLGSGPFAIALAAGLANAGYAFGAVLAADLVQRVPARTLFLACEVGFVAGSVIAMAAPGAVVYIVGRTVQGVATGMLLVAALPPLVTNHGSDKLPLTAAFISLGLFGIVTLGPLVGGVASHLQVWRPVFGVVAVLGLVGLTTGFLAFDRQARPAGIGFDLFGIPLAAAATVLPFLGTAFLSSGSFGSPAFAVPVGAGLVALVGLVAAQYLKRRPLMPVRLISHTLPLSGILVAMVTGAAFTAALELYALYAGSVLSQPPLLVGAQLTTQLAGVVIAAVLFKLALRTRWLPVLAFAGLAVVAVASALLFALSPGSAAVVIPVAGLLLGFGAGAGVAPGLFMAGLSAPSSRLGPTFALVELLRSAAAFLLAPVLRHIATHAAGLPAGIGQAATITLVVLGAGGALAGGVLLLGGRRPHRPDLDAWLDGETPAYDSPRFAAALR